MPRRFLTVPHQPQRLESDCLAACAWMVLAAANVPANYEVLLAALNVKPWGTPHRNIRQLEDLIDGIEVIYRQGVLCGDSASVTHKSCWSLSAKRPFHPTIYTRKILGGNGRFSLGGAAAYSVLTHYAFLAQASYAVDKAISFIARRANDWAPCCSAVWRACSKQAPAAFKAAAGWGCSLACRRSSDPFTR